MRFFSKAASAVALITGLLVAQPAAAQSSQGAHRQAELVEIERQRREITDIFARYWMESPMSATCAVVFVGTTAMIVLDSLSDEFRQRVSDAMRGSGTMGSGACLLYCNLSDQAECGTAVSFVTRVAWALGQLAARERVLRERVQW